MSISIRPIKRLACLAAAAALAAGAGYAQSAAKADPTTRLLLRRAALSLPAGQMPHLVEGDSLGSEQQAPYLPMIMQVSDECVADSLLCHGSIIWKQRGDMLLASVPYEWADSAASLPGIMQVAASLSAESCLDIARPYCGVDLVQSGCGLPMPFDGSGVIVGFSDIGFDANHIAFAGRVDAFYSYDAAQGTCHAALTADEIAEFGTDSPNDFHATHVAGVLAGAYMGNEYYGVAPGARIVATTSKLDDVGILCGVEDIIEYAASQGKPAVINLSLSSSLGAHDGSSLPCRYLALCAQDAIICVSAGNKGQKPITAQHTFSADAPEVRLQVNNTPQANGFRVKGITEAWSATDAPIEMRIEVYDVDAKQVVWASPWIGPGQELLINADTYPQWAFYFYGEAMAEAGVSPLNGRYCASAYYNTRSSLTSAHGPWSRYRTSLAFRAAQGTMMQVFCDASSSNLGTVAGPTTLRPNASQSISDFATAPGIVSVGACSTRNSAPRVVGSPFSWAFPTDAVAAFSSYGLGYPLFCAPGNYVVSAASGPFIETTGAAAMLSAISEVDGQDYGWMPECGTSMSSPYAAGVAALWLQACPWLSAADFIDIAQSTARTDFSDITDPRWGAGCIDAYAGLSKLLDITSLPHNLADEPAPLVEVTPERTLRITMPSGRQPGLVCLTSAAGMPADPDCPLAPGVYIIKIDNFPACKIAIR